MEVHDLPKLVAWLQEDERVVMVLSYAHDYSHSEIARVTGLPVGTVKSKLNRAKARILERMRVNETERACLTKKYYGSCSGDARRHCGCGIRTRCGATCRPDAAA